MQAIIRAYDAKIDDVNKDDMSLVARINTADVDYYRTVIDPRGVRFDNYRALKLPVLWEHGKDVHRRYTDPIGNALWIRTNGGQRPTEIIAKPRFLKDDFSRQRWEWYRDGTITGWSVNIIPDEGAATPPTTEELRARPDWEPAELVYRSSTLIEFSGTVLPGNPRAVTDERAARLLDLVHRNLAWLPDEIRPLIEERARTLAESTGGLAGGGAAVEPDEDGPVERRIVEEHGEYFVLSEDGSKRLGGPYKSREEAEHRLEQVEYFKHHKPEGRSIVSIAQEVASERRAMQQAIRDEIVALVDLMVYGRV